MQVYCHAAFQHTRPTVGVGEREETWDVKRGMVIGWVGRVADLSIIGLRLEDEFRIGYY